MSGLPSPVRESKEEAPPARQQEDLEQIVTDERIPADNRYAPASGILTPVQQPMPGAQMSDAGMIRPCAGAVHVAGKEMSRLSGRALAEARLALGTVFQHAHLVRRRSVLAGTFGRHRTLATAFGALPWCEETLALAGHDCPPPRAGLLTAEIAILKMTPTIVWRTELSLDQFSVE